MKRLLFLILFCFAWKLISAPGHKELIIMQPQKIVPFDPILYSFMKIESNFHADTVNSLGYAGVLQIGSEMIQDVNRICKLKGNPASYTLQDRFNEGKSIEIWYTIMDYYNPSYDLKRASKIWNSTGGDKYYKLINQIYNDLRKTT